MTPATLSSVSNDYKYRRRLPHMQGRGGPIAVTFCTKDRKFLNNHCRDLVLLHCLSGEPLQYSLFAAVVMPDHVHIVLQPAVVGDAVIPLKKIMQALKSSSSHSINKFLGSSGAVWQSENFDHVLRRVESLESELFYIVNNPVRKALVSQWQDYRWIYVEDSWREKLKAAGEGARATPASH